MNEYGEYDDYEDEQSHQTAQAGSDLPRDLRKQIADRNKRIKELEATLQERDAKHRETALKDAVRAAGLEEKVAKLVPSDVAPDKVGEWLEEYGDVLGVRKSAAAQEPETPAQTLDPEVQQMQAMQTMSASGSIPSGQVSEADLSSAPSREAFWELLRSAGVNPPR